ncbi:MAG: UrcA family protein [Alphaproteobacteria bacterium]|nr:UrcA family protein [Alphaproteobacteria bacterium]
MTKLKAVIVAIAAAIALAPATMADEFASKNQVEVSVAGLDKYNARDAEVLLQRIRKAAMTACRDRETVVPRAEIACRSRSVAETVASLDSPALGMAYADVFGKEPTLASRDQGELRSN